MTSEAARDAWSEAARAVELFAVEPALVGGLLLRGWPGPSRDRLCGWVRALLPNGAPLVKVPLHVTDDRLLGGVALAATLSAGRVVAERGLLSEAHGGVVVVAMAERVSPLVAATLASALDRGALSIEREGVTAVAPCRIGVVALDEGSDDERTAAVLSERLALHLLLAPLDGRAAPEEAPDRARVERARALLPSVELDAELVDALVRAALSLGIASLRAPLLAATVARVHAALEGRTQADERDVAAAARLVLGPRATRSPAPADEDDSDADRDENDDAAEPSPPDTEPADPQAAPPPDGDARDDDDTSTPKRDRPLDEIVLAAAESAIPANLLDALGLGPAARSAPSRAAGKSGVLRATTQRGRPAGVRAGQPQPGERLHVIETLRAAAPMQRLRRRERRFTPQRLDVRGEDFRVRRTVQRSETCVIFSVDASGSAALQRLAEAKGAVERVLADCYVRRDQVALFAFRGVDATLLLPPTRSLARVRRRLADLAGGGTTPLARGIDAALALALEARRRGQTPILVFMTDGRGNVDRAGQTGHAAATADALASARAIRAAGVRTLFLDTAPRARPAARQLATEMAARYLPLPHVDAGGIAQQIRTLASVSP